MILNLRKIANFLFLYHLVIPLSPISSSFNLWNVSSLHVHVVLFPVYTGVFARVQFRINRVYIM